MAVVSCRFKHWGPSTDETDFQVNTYKRQVVLEVTTNSKYDGHNTVTRGAMEFTPTASDHVVCPQLGQVYFWASELDELIWCKSIQAQLQNPGEQHTIWILTIEYESIKQAGFEPNVHPLLRPLEIERDVNFIDLVVDVDVEDPDKPIQNKAEDPFDPMPTEPFAIPVWRIKKNVAAWSDAYEVQFCNSINQTTWRHIGATKGVMRKVFATPKSEIYNGRWSITLRWKPRSKTGRASNGELTSRS